MTEELRLGTIPLWLQDDPAPGARDISEKDTVVENWKPVIGYEGFYEVSSLGRIKSFVYNGTQRSVPKILSPTINKKHGYSQICLYKNKEPKRTFRLHRLVLEAFVGLRPSKTEGTHRDGDKSNNALLNLAWRTHAENENDKYKHGTTIHGERNHQAKLTEESVKKIRELHSSGQFSQKRISEMYDVSENAIFNVVHLKRWAHVT
jgi:hypothetical protein